MAKVRKFSTGTSAPAAPRPAKPAGNVVPDIPDEAAASLAARAPIRIQGKPGNPRPRRYRQKTYSLLQEDIDTIEALVAELRQAGLYERGRSDIVRAGVKLLRGLPLEQKISAVEAVESLK